MLRKEPVLQRCRDASCLRVWHRESQGSIDERRWFETESLVYDKLIFSPSVRWRAKEKWPRTCEPDRMCKINFLVPRSPSTDSLMRKYEYPMLINIFADVFRIVSFQTALPVRRGQLKLGNNRCGSTVNNELWKAISQFAGFHEGN